MHDHPLMLYASRPGNSLAKVAAAAECSRVTLYRLMKGEQNATIDLLKRVSAATGGEVPVSAFLDRERAA
jgi:DNA-binding phage protein